MAQHRVRIKMCGMTRRNDVEQAIALGVDALGFIFYPQSSRYVSMEKASALMQDLPVFVSTVAVFVNPAVENVWQVLNTLPVHYLQFHGQESASFCQQFQYAYIKALPAHSRSDILAGVAAHPHAAAILLDTPSCTHGGTGQVFDWQMIPNLLPRPLILAGGLQVANVNTAISQCSPYAVDVCSGIETAPGIKDHDKMSQFVVRVNKQ